MILPDSVPRGVELRDHVGPERARAAMEVICERHGLSASELSPCARGSDLVYSSGDEAVIKLTAPRWADELENEVVFLGALDGALSVETPRVIAFGKLEGWTYVAATFVEGKHLDEIWPSLDHTSRLAMAARIGEVMRELHHAEVPVRERDWLAFVAEQRAGAIEHHRRVGATEPWLAALAGLLDAHPDPYAPDSDVSTLHTELLDTHILVAEGPDGWAPCGLIDFADGMRGRASYEIAGLVEFVFRDEPGALATCLSHYGWPRPFDEEEASRLFACAMLHRFASLPRMLAAAGIAADHPPDLRAVRTRLYAP